MPYEVRKDKKKFCVVNTETNESKGCSGTRGEAIGHMKALYAVEGEQKSNMASVSFNLSDIEDIVLHLKLAAELQSGLIDGSLELSQESQDEFIAHLEEALAALGEYEESETEQSDDLESVTFDTQELEEFAWEGPIVFENVVTGDNRVFNTGSINWDEATLPWAFRWQKHSGQGHAGSVPVGRVDKIQRFEDGSIHGYGVIIPGLSEEASEYKKLLETEVGGGVSVDGDSAQFEIIEMSEGPPRVEFSAMRLRALSAVDIPAFNGAKIHLVGMNAMGENNLLGLELIEPEEDGSELDTEEFFNQNHGVDGKFAPSSGGGDAGVAGKASVPRGLGDTKAPKGQGGRKLGRQAYGGTAEEYKGYKGYKAQNKMLAEVTREDRANNPEYKKNVTFGGVVKLNKFNNVDLSKFNDKEIVDLNNTLQANYRHFNIVRKIGWAEVAASAVIPAPLISARLTGSGASLIGLSRWKLNRIPPQIDRVQKEADRRKISYNKTFGLEEEIFEFQVGEDLTMEQEIAKTQDKIENGKSEDVGEVTSDDKKIAADFLNGLISATGDEVDDDIPSSVIDEIKPILSELSIEAEELTVEDIDPIELEDPDYKISKGSGWKFDSLIASAIPVLPTIQAFAEPTFDEPTPLTVTNDGRVFGHLALFNSCHIGFPGSCIKPPKGSKYQYFHTGEIETAEGDLVEVGHLTFNTGHADMSSNSRVAAEHYDNTGAVAADVRAGEDKHGVWVVGALRSTLTDENIRAFRAAPLSGDWRRIAGKLELVGALSVNVPGFPVPRVKALVAGGFTETLLTFIVDDDEEFVSDYEMQLRFNKKLSLANRIGGSTVECATSIKDFLGNGSGEEELPTTDNLPEELPEDLPKSPTKQDLEKLAKNYTQEDLMRDLPELRALLDDPEETISVKDRKNLEMLYSLFVPKGTEKITASETDTEEFYNHNHGADGKFAPSEGGGGGVTGKHFVEGHRPGDPGHKGPSGEDPAAHAAAEHNKNKKQGQNPNQKQNQNKNKGQGGNKDSADREQALKHLTLYRKDKLSARRWGITGLIAAAANGAVAAGVPLIKIVGPVSPILANPAFLTILAGVSVYNVGRKLLSAAENKKGFNSAIDRVNKRAKIDETINRLNQRKP